MFKAIPWHLLRISPIQGGPGQVWQLPPQLRNARGYHEQSARDPLHPLVHLLLLQHAGIDLVGLLRSEG